MSSEVLHNYHTTVVLLRTWKIIPRSRSTYPNGSSAPSFKLRHELSERLDRLYRHGVID